MATVYSSNYSTGTYTYTRVKVDYSGTSATATLLYSRTNSYSGQTGQIGTFTFGGVSTSYNKYFTGEQTDAVVASVNFTISTSGGTYSGTSTSSGSDHFLDFSGSVTIPAQATPPTGLDATNVTRLVEGFSATVSVTGWGGAGDATTRYRELQCWTYDPNDFVQPRRYQPVYGDALSGNITVDNSSSYSSAYGPLTIVGNTMYILGLYASNGTAGTGSQRLGAYTTLAYAPEVTISSISSTSATLSYSTKADGGQYSKTYEYSIDGGTTWTTFATVSSGSATTGTFTVSGLAAATVTVMQTRVTTTAGTTVGPNITLNTNAGPKFYGSVNSQAKEATTLYGGVIVQTITGVTGVIRPGGAGNITAFDGTTFWSAVSSSLDSEALSYIGVSYDSSSDWYAYIYFSDGTASQRIIRHGTLADLATYGITAISNPESGGVDYIDLTPIYTPSGSEAAMVNKLYGSVGGQAKLIHQGFGHVSYGP